MAITMTSGQDLLQCSVNGEGTAQGWTFSLPAGVMDNDLFQISGDFVECKSATTYRARPYSVRVMCVNGGTTRYVHKTFYAQDFGMRALGGSGIFYSGSPVTSLLSVDATHDLIVEFNVYVAADSTHWNLCVFGYTSSAFGNVSQDLNNSVMYLNWSSAPTLFFYGNTGSSGIQLSIPATLAYGVWHSFKISFTASVTPTVTIEIDGVSYVLGTSANYKLLLSPVAQANKLYFGAQGTVTIVASDLKITQNSTALLEDQLTSLNALATSVGTTTFNVSS